MANQAKTAGAHVNVTLAGTKNAPKSTFPCPLCGAALDLRESRVRKPYCVCNSCGIQIFFRGKVGISRLNDLAVAGKAPAGVVFGGNKASLAFTRLEQLRAQRKQLEQKRPLIFADRDLENAITALDREIAEVQLAIDRLANAGRR